MAADEPLGPAWHLDRSAVINPNASMGVGLGRGAGATVMACALVACSDGPDYGPPANAAALCDKWDEMDAAHEAESLDARELTTAWAALLPDGAKHDAALAFYPSAGDPGPNASGWQAAEAGDRLYSYRQDVCGK